MTTSSIEIGNLDGIVIKEYEVLAALKACYLGGAIHYDHYRDGHSATTARISALEWVINADD